MTGGPQASAPAPVRVRRKWRPRLGLVVFSVLLGVLALPVAIVAGVRVLEGTAAPLSPIEGAVLGLALLITLAIAFVLTRTITGPIHALVRRAEDIGTGGRAAIRPLDAYGTEEIALLAQSLLDLATRLVDRSDYVRSFAAHVTHELRSPLTALMGAAELLRDDDGGMAPETRRRFLDNLLADAERLNALLARLRELAQAEVALPAGRTSLEEIGADLAHRFPDLQVVVRDPCALAISAEAAAVIFGHLAGNAAQHGARRLTLAGSSDGALLRIIVSDDGTGISEGNRALVFQPLFTTRRDEGGTGMGLDIVRSLLGALGGSIALLATEAGTRFEITLPREAAEPAARR